MVEPVGPAAVPGRSSEPVVAAPIVAGAADGHEAARLVAAAAELGASVVARHAVGRGHWLLELAVPAAGSRAGGGDLLTAGAAGGGVGEKLAGVGGGGDLLTGGAAGGGVGEKLAGSGGVNVVAGLRGRGFAALAGPLTPGHALVWARRNAPSWFAPGACVCFPWSPFDRATAQVAVEIDPGAGFGAGGHPTTLGLLAGLVDPELMAAPAGPAGLADLAGRRVLDVGCGTGVLAIAAAHLGAGPVDALDIAPEALAATRANAARNGVADRVNLVDADLALCAGPYDLVVANIHAEVLAALAPDLRRLVARPAGADQGGVDRGGLLGVSGLSVAQVSRLEAALAPLRAVGHHRIDDWISLWFQW